LSECLRSGHTLGFVSNSHKDRRLAFALLDAPRIMGARSNEAMANHPAIAVSAGDALHSSQ
jgi:hypothetical protein